MKKQYKIILCAVLVTLFLGYAVPMIFVSNGTGLYTGEQKTQALLALEDVEDHLSSPSIYKLYTTKLSVLSIESTRDTQCPYIAVVALHTYFGFQYDTLVVKPGCAVVGS